MIMLIRIEVNMHSFRLAIFLINVLKMYKSFVLFFSGGEEAVKRPSDEEWIMHDELGKKKRRVVFGDGSDFQRPGWEEELIDFKKKLRMPSKLIQVAKPSSLSQSSTSGIGTASSVSASEVKSTISPAKENKSPTKSPGKKGQKSIASESGMKLN